MRRPSTPGQPPSERATPSDSLTVVTTPQPQALKAPPLTLNTLLAGAGAAATSAIVGSLFGAAGTVAGAALGSVVLTLATAVYHRSLDRTRDTVKSHISLPGGRNLQVTVQAEVPAPRKASEATTDARPGPAAPALPPASWRHPRRRTVVLAGMALLIFALGLGLVTGIELLKGSTLTRGDDGTSVGRLITGNRSPRTPAGTPAAPPPVPTGDPRTPAPPIPTSAAPAPGSQNRPSTGNPPSSGPAPTPGSQSPPGPSSAPTSEPGPAGTSVSTPPAAPGTLPGG